MLGGVYSSLSEQHSLKPVSSTGSGAGVMVAPYMIPIIGVTGVSGVSLELLN